MKRTTYLIASVCAVVSLSACGYEARDNELIGQVKKVRHETPLICPEYTSADISLGVMRNGVGSMSVQDVWMSDADGRFTPILNWANQTGAIVKITYDSKRAPLCWEQDRITDVVVEK